MADQRVNNETELYDAIVALLNTPQWNGIAVAAVKEREDLLPLRRPEKPLLGGLFRRKAVYAEGRYIAIFAWPDAASIEVFYSPLEDERIPPGAIEAVKALGFVDPVDPDKPLPDSSHYCMILHNTTPEEIAAMTIKAVRAQGLRPTDVVVNAGEEE